MFSETGTRSFITSLEQSNQSEQGHHCLLVNEQGYIQVLQNCFILSSSLFCDIFVSDFRQVLEFERNYFFFNH